MAMPICKRIVDEETVRWNVLMEKIREGKLGKLNLKKNSYLLLARAVLLLNTMLEFRLSFTVIRRLVELQSDFYKGKG